MLIESGLIGTKGRWSDEMLELSVLSFAFGGGLVAAFNPCGAAMFPAYVGYQLDAAEVGKVSMADAIFWNTNRQ